MLEAKDNDCVDIMLPFDAVIVNRCYGLVAASMPECAVVFLELSQNWWL